MLGAAAPEQHNETTAGDHSSIVGSRLVRFRASQAAVAVRGDLVGEDVLLDGATQDSRAVTPGCLFIPLAAERDGHDFILSLIHI